jgi:16S rRNA (cytosine967-C5)-methyltransferase
VHDTDSARLSRLRTRASRAGVHSLRVLLPSQLAPELQVDRVLVDAPCSELGALRRGPDLRFHHDPTALAELPALQSRLLAQGASATRLGGTLVYATCTLRAEENTGVAQAFELSHPHFQRVRPGEGWLPDHFLRDGYFTSLPHLHGTDGFFAAVYRRVA